MRSLAVVMSLMVHGAFFGWLAWKGRTPPARRSTTVAVVQQKPKPKPKLEEEAEKPKPPPPPPMVRPKVAAPAPTPPPPAPAPSPAPSPSKFATHLTLGNGSGTAAGTGPALGGALLGGPAQPPPQAEAQRKPQAKPAAPEADACDAADTKPRPLGTTQVEYPDQARADGIEGRIVVKIHVADDGSVTGVDVVESIDPSLDAIVVSVLKTWRFAPATHCGRPTAGLLAWAQRFELGD